MHDHTDKLIELALAEDIGGGDVTSLYFIPEGRRACAFVAVRHDGVVSGVEVAARVFVAVDPELDVEILIADGSRVAAGAMLIRVEGSARSILTAERTALNFLQRLSGVATLTARYVEQVKGTNARVLDTRKTTPGYRFLEKQAVVHGGGTNHRMGLYDRAMVKDNHLAAEGGVEAVQAAIHQLKSEKPGVEVELEADELDQVREFLGMEGVDHILLDNMSLEQLTAAVTLRGDRGRPQFEASGGVTLKELKEIARTGVDFISVGALTHSAPSLDIGLDFESL
ncbi:carboxylating nicotinate-nucleotide diphosphorylase [Luteolibacter yonseiensis]|uniref:Probable nicotinate-nucleotide pyrophosphorylase [carboxylating] n=1 Tax=Luteolibacter yonseiensis TaxID=1144680 RepID=A0A934R1S4_9BACT|nr:carboxylating nicotinate-nucleotide diphosphorylase [Luteolibacter yonseiensis]MBK1815187.1 carboxylating nicotinate-nucleotide diphosphorylase [Luteolibacter yonseiensis]